MSLNAIIVGKILGRTIHLFFFGMTVRKAMGLLLFQSSSGLPRQHYQLKVTVLEGAFDGGINK